MKYLPLVWSNLKRKKLRTFLTLLSIVIAFVLYGILCSIQQALTGGIQMAGADRLIVRNKVSFIQPLPISYKQRIERITNVALATHLSWFGGIYQDPKNFFAQMALVPDEYLQLYPEILLPPEQKQAWLQTRTGAIVGRTTAKRFNWKVGDRIPIQATIYPKAGGDQNWDFDLVGIFDGAKKGTDTSPFFFRYDYLDEGRNGGKGDVGWYVIKIKDPEHAADIAANIDAEFANSPAETKTEAEGVMYQGFAKQIGNIILIVTSILVAVFSTILLVAGNTMAQAVRERTGELGVLKAIGFTDTQVLVLVLAESCILAVLGGLIGLGLALLVAAGGDPTKGMLPMFYLPSDKIVIGLVLSIILGIVAGVFPALQAMRLRVALALRRM